MPLKIFLLLVLPTLSNCSKVTTGKYTGFFGFDFFFGKPSQEDAIRPEKINIKDLNFYLIFIQFTVHKNKNKVKNF